MIRGRGGQELSFRYNTLRTNRHKSGTIIRYNTLRYNTLQTFRHKSGTIRDAAGHIIYEIRGPLKATEIHMLVINIQVAFKVT